jgi:L-lactate utilization protein LutC
MEQTQTQTQTQVAIETITKTIQSLKNNHFDSLFVATKEEALDTIKELVTAGASVMNGASRTLEEVGYVEYLKSGAHPWKNLHEAVLLETDPEKQALLRKQSVLSDFYLGSAHALTETGEIIIASNSGSQLPHLAFTSPNVILVVGAQKITPTLLDGLKRIDEVVVPLEDVRMKEVYGYGTLHAKTLIMHKENPAMGRKVTVIIVGEPLGF